ncbi:MAG: hypothetical protein M1396_02090 [Chloroflexi bacterium]|nr:hypothetical protein [Chloroflexota bacterium]
MPAVFPFLPAAPRSHQRPSRILPLLFSLAAYFTILWIAVVPDYPVPHSLKAALGFTIAGFIAGWIAYPHSLLAAILGYSSIIFLSLAAVFLTLFLFPLGPAFLINEATAHGSPQTVGHVRGALLQALFWIFAITLLCTLLGSFLASMLRRTGYRRPTLRLP